MRQLREIIHVIGRDMPQTRAFLLKERNNPFRGPYEALNEYIKVETQRHATEKHVKIAVGPLTDEIEALQREEKKHLQHKQTLVVKLSSSNQKDAGMLSSLSTSQTAKPSLQKIHVKKPDLKSILS